jgi:hypothetical protein
MSEMLKRQAAEILRQDAEIQSLRATILRLHGYVIDAELQLAEVRSDLNALRQQEADRGR